MVMNPDSAMVRVAVDGSSRRGRETLRGVIQYTRSYTNWSLHIELDPYVPKTPEWADDDIFIMGTSSRELFAIVESFGKPIVSTMAHHESQTVPAVRSDDVAIGEMAADYLLEKGFRQFIFAAGGDGSAAARMRFHGFQKRLAERNCTCIACDMPHHQNIVLLPFDEFNRAIDQTAKPVGVLLGHDGLGRTVADITREKGWSIPEQVALLGVDNDEFNCETCQPPLSSIEIPYQDVGHHVAAMAHRILRGEGPGQTSIMVGPSQVITRQSTDIIAMDNPRLVEALKYIRKHACDPCTVEDVGDQVMVSRRWLQREFYKTLQRSPHDEITRLRMERAIQLLNDPRMSLDAVADRTGYAHVQNFVCAFRKYTGQTPAAYRRKQRQR